MEYFLVFFPNEQEINTPGYRLTAPGGSIEGELVANSVVTPLTLDGTTRKIIRDADDAASLAQIIPATTRARRLPIGGITQFEDRQPNDALPYVAVDLRDEEHPQLIAYRRGATPLDPEAILIPVEAGAYAVGERALETGPTQRFAFSTVLLRRSGGIESQIHEPLPRDRVLSY